MSTTSQPVSTSGIIGPARFSYLNFFEPSAMKIAGQENNKRYYSVSLLIPKNTAEGQKVYAKAKAMVDAAIREGIEKKTFSEAMVKNVKFWNPIQDGDQKINKQTGKVDETYAGHWFISTKSEEKNGRPQIVNELGQAMPVVSPDNVYSGMYGRAHVNFYAYNNASFGIGCSLNHLQKLADGEKFGGKPSVEGLFNDDFVFDSGAISLD